MQVESAAIDKILTLLEETPRRLTSLTDGLERAQLQIKLDEEAWSVNDILAHLRACADVWGKSMMMMLAQDHPTLRYVSPRTWMRKSNYPAQEFHGSLQAFTQQRNDLLQSLKNLAIEDWSRGATFTGTVKGRDQTVFSYAQRIADHETQHLDQIESVLNAIQHH
jgi:hypothetical protein